MDNKNACNEIPNEDLWIVKGIEMGKCNALWTNMNNCSFTRSMSERIVFFFFFVFIYLDVVAFQTNWICTISSENNASGRILCAKPKARKKNTQTQNYSFGEFVRIQFNCRVETIFDKANSMEPVAVENCVVVVVVFLHAITSKWISYLTVCSFRVCIETLMWQRDMKPTVCSPVLAD